MELQFQKNICKYLNCVVREVQNTELTQEIRLSDGMPDIGRVLASWGQVVLRSKEWRGDTVTVTGGLMVWVLYAPEDGTAPRSVDSWIPFQLKWNLPLVDREGPVRILPILRFVDSRGLSARKMMVRAGVGAMGEILCPMEAEVYSPGEIPEDVELLKRTYPVRLPRESGEKTFFVDEEVTVSATSGPEKVLGYMVSPQIQDKKVMANKAVFRGALDLHLIYRGQDGLVHSWDTSFPFSQFAELEMEYSPDSQADVQMGVTSMELDMNEQGQIRMKCGLLAQYLVDDRELLELIEDAYSPCRNLEMSSLPLELPAILENRKETINVQQSLSGQSGDAADILFLPDFPRCFRTEKGMEAQLSGVFQILCYGDEGMLRSGTSRWESIYDLPAGDNSRIDVLTLPKFSGYSRVEGSDMTLQGEMNLQILTTAKQGMPMITDLNLGECSERDSTMPSLILCRAEGEELWDIAKRCNSTVGAIQRANNLQGEPLENQMLLIPVK